MESTNLALAGLEEITRKFLLGESSLAFSEVMSAVVKASEAGASQEEIRQALGSAQARTQGKQQPDAAARLAELLSRP